MNGERGILISGIGGQGIVFAGRALARAWFAQGWRVALRYTYGAEVMGTAVHSEVVASSQPLLCPYLELADAAVVLHRAALGEVLPRLARGALLVVDEGIRYGQVPSGVKVEVRPFVLLSSQGRAGDPGRASPMVALGFLAARGMVELDPLLAAVDGEPGAAENRALLQQGFALA